MKRILAFLAAATISLSAVSATLVPVQLLNPTGSTAGQAIISTGASSAPAWGTAGAGLYAPLASPAFTGVPTAPSAAAGTSTSQLATTAFVYGTFAAPTIGVCSSAACAGTFTGITTNTLSTFSNTTSGASILEMTGNGATTPNKFLGVLGGSFTIYSSSGSSQLLGLSDTGTLTVTNIAANATGTQATAGNQGFAVSYSTGAASATAGSPLNVASTTTPLSVGVWDVTCTGQFVPAGSTVTQAAQIGVSTTSGALPGYAQLTNSAGVTSAGFSQVFTSPSVRIPVTTPTTVYCVAQANFTVSTMTIGGTITARLVH